MKRTANAARNSIHRDLSIGLTIAIVLSGLLAGSIQYVRASRDVGTTFGSYKSARINSFARTLSVHLWNFDGRAIERAASELLNSRDISGVRVLDENNRLIFDTGPFENSIHSDSGVNEVYFEGKVIGRFEILFDEYTLATTRRNIILTALLVIVCVVAMFIPMMHFLLNRSLLKPLKDLRERVSHLSEGAIDESSTDAQKDELQDVIGFFSALSQKLLEGEKALSDKAESLDQAQRSLMEEIAKRERVQAREHDLEKQLHHSQKMDAIGQLAGGIAHDFNNILQAMLGFCKLASELEPDDESSLAYCLHEIESGGLRAADLVSRLMTFSRSEEGRREAMDLEPILTEALKLVRSTLPTTIDIHADLSTGTGHVMADATQIHQIVLNICTNAAQAMERTGGSIRVGLRHLSVEKGSLVALKGLLTGDYVALSFADTGPGIDHDNLDRIFEPFFTTKEVGQGTGLGLATVHGIVKSMGGVIEVESNFPQGSVFNVYLPTCLYFEQQDVKLERENEYAKTGTGRILYVDDEEAIVKFAKIALTNRGFDVLAFTDPKEGLRAFADDPNGFSVVVTDLTMPAMTGLDLARHVRKLNGSIPILLASGRIEGNESAFPGISEILEKPIDIAVLVRTINRHVSAVSEAAIEAVGENEPA